MSFSSTLLAWYQEHGRDLPWRQTHDPYAIWLSEIILQQTQVKQGWDYWERFMRRWPTVEALAAATEDEVLREWQGLGYYSRARNLHFAARQIVAMGRFPDTLDAMVMSTVSSPVTSASTPPSTPPKAKNSSPPWRKSYYPSPPHLLNTTKPSWTLAPCSAPLSRPNVLLVP